MSNDEKRAPASATADTPCLGCGKASAWCVDCVEEMVKRAERGDPMPATYEAHGVNIAAPRSASPPAASDKPAPFRVGDVVRRTETGTIVGWTGAATAAGRRTAHVMWNEGPAKYVHEAYLEHVQRTASAPVAASAPPPLVADLGCWVCRVLADAVKANAVDLAMYEGMIVGARIGLGAPPVLCPEHAARWERVGMQSGLADVFRQAADQRRASAPAEPEEWGDRPTPEDDAIEAAFPTRSGRHDTYREAMRLVGARHSKGALVALVNWLLIRIEGTKAK